MIFFPSANMDVGNVLPIGGLPEGTIICNLEEKCGDRGRIARASGNYAQVGWEEGNLYISPIYSLHGQKFNTTNYLPRLLPTILIPRRPV